MEIFKRALWTPVAVLAFAALAAAPAAADHVINDDCIIRGSTCIGLDCTNGMAFGFDTLVLKENNLRIFFDDTSNSASFPTANWRIIANDSSNGGDRYLAFEDSDNGRQTFRVFQGARANALVVSGSSRVGLGTATPAVELHIVDGDTPTLRLQQDGSSGFQPQTWDVAGNETNFFIRDVTNGSRLPIRSRPGAPTSSIDIASDGDVGMGTSAPEFELEVERSDADNTFIQIQNTNASAQLAGLSVRNTDASYVFQVNSLGNFQISQAGTGGAEFDIIDGAAGNADKFAFRRGATQLVEIQADGDVNSLTGNFGTISDRNAKTDIIPVDPRQVLAKVSALPISTWRYKTNSDELHMGPMGQDFWAAFGLYEGPTSVSLSDLSGVALAAVQGLHQEIRERDALIRQLSERLAALEARLAQ